MLLIGICIQTEDFAAVLDFFPPIYLADSAMLSKHGNMDHSSPTPRSEGSDWSGLWKGTMDTFPVQSAGLSLQVMKEHETCIYIRSQQKCLYW